METKDLVLLMLIPVILVSLVIYTDKSPAIIGAVTHEPKKESNILGTYSINPSFKTKINYDLDDYTRIKAQLDFVIKCAEEGKDIETCINEINRDKDFNWQLGCDKGAEKILYDFAEFYQDCFDSDDTNCLCRKSFEFSDKEIQQFGLVNKIYRLQLEQYKKSKKIEIDMQDPKLSYKINTNELSVWYPSDIVLAYSDKLRSINMIFRYKKNEEIQAIDEYKVLDKKEILLYKNQINNVKRVDFVEQIDNFFIFPNRETAVTGNLPPCQIKPKNIYKFCVTQNNYKVMAYDKLDGQVKERNPVIKFASYVPDLPPQPLKNIEIIDRPKAEKSVLLKWDKSNEKDIAKYRIYYVDSSLKIFDSKISTEEIRKNQNVASKEIDAKSVEINAPLKLDECEFDYQNKKCIFSTTDIENGKLYYSTFFDSYVYSINLPEDKKSYDFTVTAVDKNNNEINNIDPKQKLPIVKNSQSIDDLPPDSAKLVFLTANPLYESSSKQFTFRLAEQPSLNIDGSELKDFKNYRVYYKKFEKLETLEQRKQAFDQIMESFLKDLKNVVPFEQTASAIKVSLQSEDLQLGNIIYFFVVAEDRLENPKQDQFKMKETGAVKLEFLLP